MVHGWTGLCGFPIWPASILGARSHLGLTIAQVAERVAPHRLRVIDADQIEASEGRVYLTADLRADRVNVLVQDGIVTSAATF
jgi:4'-phosphopantetheinyl transferase EntD